jgi:parvulin-like peptidyl-prolyl isomerase
MMQEYLGSRVGGMIRRIGINELRDYYDEHLNDFRVEDSVEWLDLFVAASRFATRDEARLYAEQLAARARNGEDFTALVKQYDCGDSSLRNGSGIGAKRGEILPREAEAIVFELKEGQVGPLVELGSGFHIVKVARRTYAGQRPFDAAVQGEIRKKLQAQIGEREYKRIIAELKERIPYVVVSE